MKRWLIGDALALLAVTLIGFASHDELVPAAAGRMLVTWLGLTLAWGLLAGRLGLFAPSFRLNRSSVLDLALAMLFAAPLGLLLRAVWLHAALLPSFALVMAGFSFLGVLAWRWLALRFLK